MNRAGGRSPAEASGLFTNIGIAIRDFAPVIGGPAFCCAKVFFILAGVANANPADLTISLENTAFSARILGIEFLRACAFRKAKTEGQNQASNKGYAK